MQHLASPPESSSDSLASGPCSHALAMFVPYSPYVHRTKLFLAFCSKEEMQSFAVQYPFNYAAVTIQGFPISDATIYRNGAMYQCLPTLHVTPSVIVQINTGLHADFVDVDFDMDFEDLSASLLHEAKEVTKQENENETNLLTRVNRAYSYLLNLYNVGRWQHQHRR